MILDKAVETFLGGQIRVEQPALGFRSGLDAVMLAAAVRARPAQTALELGAGAGHSLACAWRAQVPHLDDREGVEVGPVRRPLRGAGRRVNGMAKLVSFTAADIFALPPGLKREFDHVLVNPPFHGEGQASPDAARARALKDEGQLTDWLKLGLQRTVSGGYFTVIFSAARLAEVLAALPAGGINIFPLWPRAGEPAKRVILSVRKGSAAPCALLAGLVLHEESGAYTAEADAVLRCGAALALPGAGR